MRGVSMHDGPASSLTPVSLKMSRQRRFTAAARCSSALPLGRVPYRTIVGSGYAAPWQCRHLAVFVSHRENTTATASWKAAAAPFQTWPASRHARRRVLAGAVQSLKVPWSG